MFLLPLGRLSTRRLPKRSKRYVGDLDPRLILSPHHFDLTSPSPFHPHSVKGIGALLLRGKSQTVFSAHQAWDGERPCRRWMHYAAWQRLSPILVRRVDELGASQLSPLCSTFVRCKGSRSRETVDLLWLDVEAERGLSKEGRWKGANYIRRGCLSLLKGNCHRQDYIFYRYEVLRCQLSELRRKYLYRSNPTDPTLAAWRGRSTLGHLR